MSNTLTPDGEVQLQVRGSILEDGSGALSIDGEARFTLGPVAGADDLRRLVDSLDNAQTGRTLICSIAKALKEEIDQFVLTNRELS